MSANATFLEIARQHGYTQQAASNAFDIVQARVKRAGYLVQTTFYVYRNTTKRAPEDSRPGHEHHTPERQRWLLAFSSPDSALAYAQHHRLRPTPRLHALTLAQLLAVMLQQSTIQALIFTEEGAPLALDIPVPTVFRLNRFELLYLLRGE